MSFLAPYLRAGRLASMAGSRLAALPVISSLQFHFRLSLQRHLSHSAILSSAVQHAAWAKEPEEESSNQDVAPAPLQRPEHAVISTFDLFSIGGV